MQVKLSRWTLMFPAEPRELSLTRVPDDAPARPFFKWWLRAGPLCLFRLAGPREELEKIDKLNVKRA